eukprot:sb/3474382/
MCHISTKVRVVYRNRIGQYCCRLPSPIWKDGGDNDKPYRTIKTLLHKLCLKNGAEVLQDLQCLRVEYANILKPIVDSILTILGIATSKDSQIFGGNVEPTGEQKTQLEGIFDKLKCKDLIRIYRCRDVTEDDLISKVL